MITIGIDPGLTGAIGVLNDGHFVAVEDMPIIVKGNGKVKNEVDVSGTIRLLRQYGEPSEYISCVIERVNARPNQGVSTIFSLGDSFGCARSAVSACRFELRYVTPQVWKKHFKLTSDKEQCRAYAVKLWPDAPLHLKKHQDRAEALLMSKWLYDTFYD